MYFISCLTGNILKLVFKKLTVSFLTFITSFFFLQRVDLLFGGRLEESWEYCAVDKCEAGVFKEFEQSNAHSNKNILPSVEEWHQIQCRNYAKCWNKISSFSPVLTPSRNELKYFAYFREAAIYSSIEIT